jgi:hypothetical protein
MGGHPWFYFVDYEPDVNAALQKLRQQEFRAGRYNPAIGFPEFPIGHSHLAPERSTARSPAPWRLPAKVGRARS